MATNRPNLGLQVALIIFVLTTISLAVSSFMLFKDREEEKLAHKNADVLRDKANDDTAKIAEELKKIKTIVGKGSQDKADGIVEEFKADMMLYSATYPDPAQTYPQALKYQLDKYLKVLDQLAVVRAEKARIEEEKGRYTTLIANATAEYNQKYKAQGGELLAMQAKNNEDVDKYTGIETHYAQRLDDQKKQYVDLENATAMEKKTMKSQVADLEKRNTNTDLALRKYMDISYKSPAGEIIRVNQRERKVWINRGQADGIKRQMTFTVYDQHVENVAGKNVESKGTIEVTRIVDTHLAEAQITNDQITNPIMEMDKIVSPTYLPGEPQHFAIAGLVHIDDDHQSDLKQLLTIISNNGGVVDAIVDETGKRTGLITPAVKLLILGDRPNEGPQSPDAGKAYNRIVKEADDAHIGTMSVPDFLRYMGFQGHARTTPLGGGAASAPASPQPVSGGDAGSAFRKRPQ